MWHCHIHYATVYMQLGVELNSKQRHRQDTYGFSYKLHSLTLRLINTVSQHCRELETTLK